MRFRLRAAGICLALLLASAGAPPVAANEPDEIEGRDFAGGNATDSGRIERQARLLFYQTRPALVRYLMSSMEGRVVLYRLWLFRQLYWQPRPPAAEPQPGPMPEPGDAPAESVLDEIEENGEPLLMVGLPGSGTALKAFDDIGNAETPPPESILDQIEDSPKPAVNQATPPKAVETNN